jgi:hypothetical protein
VDGMKFIQFIGLVSINKVNTEIKKLSFIPSI